jgi:hypothetical protein
MSSERTVGIRKQPIAVTTGCAGTPERVRSTELDLASLATIRYSSEDLAHPVEHLVDGSSGRGAPHWVSARSDVTEQIVLEFDEPQHISHVEFEAEESALERTQEVAAEYSLDGGATYRREFVQEYTFSPSGATYQCESLAVELRGVTQLRLTVVPNKGGSGKATLTSLRLFS